MYTTLPPNGLLVVRVTRWLLGFGFVGFMLLTSLRLLAQQSSPPFDSSQVAVPDTPPIAASGHAIYQEKCAPCHGNQGMGDGPTAKDLSSPPLKFADPEALFEKSPAQLFFVAKFGRLEKLMPPWKDQLSDAEIWQALAYAWTLHTDETYVNEGRDLYTVGCASCHGAMGAGDGTDATPGLVNLGDAAYAIAHSQADWMQGWLAAHPEAGAEWSLDDQRKVLEYVRSFSYVPPWESPYRPSTGVIGGTAVQRTAGGAPVAGLRVALEAYMDFQRVALFTGTLTTEGAFVFQELATDPAIVYIASVMADGVSYSSPILALSPQTSTITTTISVFAQTEDASGIRINRAHWIFDAQPGALIVGEIFEFSNTSDRTFVGRHVDGIESPVTLALVVPDGAQEISFENGTLGDRFQQQGTRIYDTTPVIPGAASRQIIMRYTLPHTGEQLAVEHSYLYPVNTLSLLVADLPQLQVDVPTLTSLENQDLQGSSYRLWQGSNLQPGTIAIKLSGLLAKDSIDPRAIESTENLAPNGVAAHIQPLESWTAWFVVGVLLLPLIGVVGWSWRKGFITAPSAAPSLATRRSELIKRIAQLDDLHALEKIEDTAWQRKRSQMKAELLEVHAQMQANQQPHG